MVWIKGFMSLWIGGKRLIFKSLAENARENPSLSAITFVCSESRPLLMSGKRLRKHPEESDCNVNVMVATGRSHFGGLGLRMSSTSEIRRLRKLAPSVRTQDATLVLSRFVANRRLTTPTVR